MKAKILVLPLTILLILSSCASSSPTPTDEVTRPLFSFAITMFPDERLGGMQFDQLEEPRLSDYFYSIGTLDLKQIVAYVSYDKTYEICLVETRTEADIPIVREIFEHRINLLTGADVAREELGSFVRFKPTIAQEGNYLMYMMGDKASYEVSAFKDYIKYGTLREAVPEKRDGPGGGAWPEL